MSVAINVAKMIIRGAKRRKIKELYRRKDRQYNNN